MTHRPISYGLRLATALLLTTGCSSSGSTITTAGPIDAAAGVDAPPPPPPMHALNLNFDAPVRAAVHAAGAWYLGGDFTLADAHAAPNALALLPSGAPA